MWLTCSQACNESHHKFEPGRVKQEDTRARSDFPLCEEERGNGGRLGRELVEERREKVKHRREKTINGKIMKVKK